MEDLSLPPLVWLAGRWPSSWPQVAGLLHTSVSSLLVGAGLVVEGSKVTPNPEVLLSGCTCC